MNEQLKKTLETLPNDELLEIASFVLDLCKEREPAVTLKAGQIVEWENDSVHIWPKKRIEFGFIERDCMNDKRPQVIQYLGKYKCFRMTYVDASKIVAHDEFIDWTPIAERFKSLYAERNGNPDDESV